MHTYLKNLTNNIITTIYILVMHFYFRFSVSVNKIFSLYYYCFEMIYVKCEIRL